MASGGRRGDTEALGVVRLSDLTGAQRRVVLALIEASRRSSRLSPSGGHVTLDPDPNQERRFATHRPTMGEETLPPLYSDPAVDPTASSASQQDTIASRLIEPLSGHRRRREPAAP